MATTRGDIKRRIRLGLVEVPGSPGWDDPLLLDEVLIQACDHVARLSDCFWTYFDLDINGSPTPQAEFCLPRGGSGELYKIKRARVTLDSGSYAVLREGKDFVNVMWMDRYCPEWATNPASGAEPALLVFMGADAMLYPLPNWDEANGLRLYGFGTPGRLWNSAETDISDADEFPLPGYAELAVETYAKMLRCEQFPSKDNLARHRIFSERFERELLPGVARDAAVAYQRGNLG